MSGASPSPPDSSLDEATEEGFILVREGADSKGNRILSEKRWMDSAIGWPLVCVCSACFSRQDFSALLS